MAEKKKKEIIPIILKNGIIVAGHPRSGTSLACQLVESAGVNFPSDLGADKYNKEGYFEIANAKELEKSLIDEAMTDKNILELNKVVKTLNSTSGLTGLKIVHIPAIFFYSHIAKNMRVVFIYRNPSDVKSSMFRRGISQFKLSWFDNNNALVAAHENMPKSIVISYESIIEGRESVKKGFKKLGLNINLDVVKKGHRTQENSSIILTGDETRLFKHLKKLEKKSCS
ncbi:MAG: sulfotransferase domain-containing protein [Acidobacteriota bacterium]